MNSRVTVSREDVDRLFGMISGSGIEKRALSEKYSNPALGAGGGAILAALLSLLTPKDEDESTLGRLLRYALGGAALGGFAGWGYDSLKDVASGNVMSPTPEHKPGEYVPLTDDERVDQTFVDVQKGVRGARLSRWLERHPNVKNFVEGTGDNASAESLAGGAALGMAGIPLFNWGNKKRLEHRKDSLGSRSGIERARMADERAALVFRNNHPGFTDAQLRQAASLPPPTNSGGPLTTTELSALASVGATFPPGVPTRRQYNELRELGRRYVDTAGSNEARRAESLRRTTERLDEIRAKEVRRSSGGKTRRAVMRGAGGAAAALGVGGVMGMLDPAPQTTEEQQTWL